MSECEDLLARLARRLTSAGLMLATAESCTGGLVAKLLTDRPGSSAWFERGFVTYSNAAKSEMLGVDPGLIAAHGAVSEATVRAMAEGAVARSAAGVALAVSGVAGPDGATERNPVGSVWFAWSDGARTTARHELIAGDRAQVREQAAVIALQGLLQHLDEPA